jgi:hypothetical protein
VSQQERGLCVLGGRDARPWVADGRTQGRVALDALAKALLVLALALHQVVVE